jgi:hypothetical protein
MHFRTILGPFEVTQHCKVEFKNRKANKVVPKIGVFRENNTLPIQLVKMWINLKFGKDHKVHIIGDQYPNIPQVEDKILEDLK